MSKYEPLQTFLKSRREGEVRLTFTEIERILGFALPPSAREHRAWWANNPGTHVGVRAWRDAGWKTSQVDMAAEQVTFGRDSDLARDGRYARLRGPPLQPPGVRERPEAFEGESITLNLDHLSRSAVRLIDETADAEGVSKSDAVAKLLDWVVLERRRQMIAALRETAGPVTGDSVQMIRELRDSR